MIRRFRGEREEKRAPKRRRFDHLSQPLRNTLVVGCDAPEPILSYRLLAALAPYEDITNEFNPRRDLPEDRKVRQTSVADEMLDLENGIADQKLRF